MTYINIAACTEPRDRMITLICSDKTEVKERIYDSKNIWEYMPNSDLTHIHFKAFNHISYAGELCEEYQLDVVCSKNGFLMPKTIKRGYDIVVYDLV